MTLERTLGIIKPDCVAKQKIGEIIARITSQNLKVIGLKMLQLSEAQAKQLYAVHAERPFYGDLVSFMTSGPVVVLALEGENAVATYRNIMGATNPAEAEAGTIRADFAESIDAMQFMVLIHSIMLNRAYFFLAMQKS